MQSDLKPISSHLTLSESAQIVGVSVATIRNWIKSGTLESVKKGLVSKRSVDAVFKRNSVKLKSRVNKIRKSTHDHVALSARVKTELGRSSADEVGRWYESLLSESFRNQNGIYYTPDDVVADMFHGIECRRGDTFLDPCCGSGNFLIHAILSGFQPENVYGFDTDPNAIAIARQRVFEMTGVRANIQCADFLLSAVKRRFDCIVTNPPWGNKVDRKARKNLGARYDAGKSLDTSALFFAKSLRLLAQHGRLCMVLPEAFYNVSAFEDVRKLALNFQITRLIDYGRPFKTLLTRAQAISLVNCKPIDAGISCEFAGQTTFRAQSDFETTPKHIFNFWLDASKAEVISHLFSVDHVTLKQNATWGLGIVTGDNRRFLQDVARPENRPILKGKDIFKDRIAEASTFIVADSRLQQVARMSLYDAPEKLVYRFISSDLCFQVDDRQRLLLNSANMLVLNPDFPITHSQLADLLNSSVMNWVFKSLFNTRKILRGDLEKLPLHFRYFEKHAVFDETSFCDFLQLEVDGDGFKKKNPRPRQGIPK